ncbi:gamma-aminobutyric acid receptor subunit theta [Suncus etruscus]|uniref:gamma-aminobutyric acid receptor subunit theta n=1 Tax=Suncus etruscus TaxID=109475 RepID=UPI002110C00C|nr:gamma-aminobutyric acid receptor subunit theta [Suncus etruscus]
MRFRGTLRMVLLVLLVRTWLVGSENRRPTSKEHLEHRDRSFKNRYACGFGALGKVDSGSGIQRREVEDGQEELTAPSGCPYAAGSLGAQPAQPRGTELRAPFPATSFRGHLWNWDSLFWEQLNAAGIFRGAVPSVRCREERWTPDPSKESTWALSSFEPRAGPNNCANQTVVHSILERLMASYDNRLRPNFGGAPVPVGVSLHVTNIEKISEESMEYTITLYLHQTWRDSRLTYHETDQNLTLDSVMLNKLWIPDCYFLNGRNSFVHERTVENRMFLLQPDGTLHYGMRFTTTLPCGIDLHNYPLDKQACKLDVESYAYSDEDLILYWNGGDDAVHGTEDLIIPRFTMLERTLSLKDSSFYTGCYTRLVMNFVLQRHFSGYFVQVYWPIILFTIISWIAFWMKCDSSSARVTVGLSSTLVLNSISTYVQENLPQITCIKAIDIYMAVCFVLVILSLIEYVYINYVYYSRRGTRRHNRQRRRIRRIMRRYRFEEVIFQVRFLELHTGLVSVRTRFPITPAKQDKPAPLATSDSLSSLNSIIIQAPLASSESLSSLSSPSRSSEATRDSLDEMPSTSAQALHRSGMSGNGSKDDSIVPSSQIHMKMETTSTIAEEPTMKSSLDESHDTLTQQSQNRRAFPNISDILEYDPDGPIGGVKPKRNDIDIEKGLISTDEESWDLSKGFMGSDQDKDSSSASDDSVSSNAKCSDKFFNPAYIYLVDKGSRYIFPFIFVMFNFIYWIFHCN